MYEQLEITTERLILRSITPQLIHHLFENKTKDVIMSYFGYDESGFERLKGMHEKGMETDRISLFFFLLIRKDTMLPIGECGFHSWNTFHRRAELFYWLHNDSVKQKGYMKEALAKVLDHGFNELEIHRIEALIAKWNTPSYKLLQHYGFTFEGTMREDYNVEGKNENSECYSLLRWEWNESDGNNPN